MGSKIIQTPHGLIIVDENFDETSLDISSMLPPKSEIYPSPDADAVSPPKKDVLSVNGEEYSGKIKIYSVQENKKTGQKTIKVILVS
jgi:hypothetical protein